jgi:hypothetical protein
MATNRMAERADPITPLIGLDSRALDDVRPLRGLGDRRQIRECRHEK